MSRNESSGGTEPMPRVYRSYQLNIWAVRARSIADTVLNRLGLHHRGRDLLRYFSGNQNSEILIRLASAEQNSVVNLESGQRQSADIGQLESAINSSPDIADTVSGLVSEKLKDAASKANG